VPLFLLFKPFCGIPIFALQKSKCHHKVKIDLTRMENKAELIKRQFQKSSKMAENSCCDLQMERFRWLPCG